MSNKLLTLDFETYYESRGYTLKKHTTMEYITHEKFRIHGVGVILDGFRQWFTDMDAFRQFLKNVGEDGITLLCHNTMFDGMILHHWFDYHPAHYADTKLMSMGMFIGQSASLAALAERLFPNDPAMRKGKELVDFADKWDLTPQEQDTLGGYCLNDCDLTLACYEMMVDHYPDREWDLIDLTLKFFCQPRLKVDVPLVEQTLEDATKARNDTIKASGLSESRLASNQKFSRWIEEQGIEPPTKISPKTGEETFAGGKNDLEFQLMRKANPELEHVWEGRIAAKSNGEITRAQRFLDTAEMMDGFMPVPLTYYSAHTGRYGGAEKLNLQNLGRESPLRRALVADKGELVYVADSSNIEARMNNWNAGQLDMVEKFRRNEDIYSAFAAEHVYHKPVNKHDNPMERFVGKAAVLGLGYGMGAPKFRTTLATGAMGPEVVIPHEESVRVVQAYRQAHYMIKRYWNQCDIALAKMLDPNINEPWGVLHILPGMIVLPNGMALQYPGLRGQEDHNGNIDFEYYNGRYWKKIYGALLTENIIQALSRIVLFEQMLQINEYAEPYGGRAVLNVHDEIIVVAPDFGAYKDSDGNWHNTSEADAFYEGIEHILRQPLDWCPDLPLNCEGGYSYEYSK